MAYPACYLKGDDMHAALPMYDWPESAVQTDRLWADMRDALRKAGINAPDRLSRDVSDISACDDLLVGQVCGRPFANELREEVSLIGAVPMGLATCAPGHYYSVIIARTGMLGDPALIKPEHRLAFNDPGSQSGYHCLQEFDLMQGLEQLETGSHRHSIQAVAEGRADYAAIDARSWALARAFEPACRHVEVIAETAHKPAPVLISHRHEEISEIRSALTGFFVPASPRDYDCFL